MNFFKTVPDSLIFCVGRDDIILTAPAQQLLSAPLPILYKDFLLTLKTEVSDKANQNKNTGGCYILLLTSVLKVSSSYNIGLCNKMAPVTLNYG